VASVELGLLEATTLTDLEALGWQVGDEVGTVGGAMLKERGRPRRSSTREEDDDATKGRGMHTRPNVHVRPTSSKDTWRIPQPSSFKWLRGNAISKGEHKSQNRA
jgi:hypothetical protein